MFLLRLAATIIITLLVVFVKCWVYVNSVLVPFGYSAESLVSKLFVFIIVLPTIYLTVGAVYA